jgi:RNA recognition motif-containing protein
LGCAFVQVATEEDANQAVMQLGRSTLHQRKLFVEHAREPLSLAATNRSSMSTDMSAGTADTPPAASDGVDEENTADSATAHLAAVDERRSIRITFAANVTTDDDLLNLFDAYNVYVCSCHDLVSPRANMFTVR